MMATSNVKARCSRCEEVQRLYLAVLEDKRTILIRLQREQERVRKLSKEIESVKREKTRTGDRTRTEESTNTSMVSLFDKTLVKF